MPNTIAHFAVAGWVTRAFIKTADVKWIYLGCVLPDIPWILQRLSHILPWGLDRYDIRAYAVLQSSLVLCLVLAAALALVARHSERVFMTLSVGSLIHLLLDATQIKWANGVLLLVPFEWQLVSFGWYWPESLPTYVLTFAGVIYLAYGFKSATQPTVSEFQSSSIRWLASSLLITMWLVLPAAWLEQPYTHNHHFISTLKNEANREGQLVEFDRNRLAHSGASAELMTAFGETLSLNGDVAHGAEVVSIRGQFQGNGAVHVHDYHAHSPFRDRSTLVGLLLVLLTWMVFFIRQYREHLKQCRASEAGSSN